MTSRDYAVKRGKNITTFQHAIDAWRYWRAVLGATLLRRTRRGWEQVL